MKDESWTKTIVRGAVMGAIVGLILWLAFGCAAFQQSSATQAEPVPVGGLSTEEIKIICTAACTAHEGFDFTVCGSEMMRAVPMLTMLQAYGPCDAKCDDFVGKLKANGLTVDTNCLISATNCDRVSVCLGVGP